MLSLERADAGVKITWWSLLGLVLVPLLVAGGFLWATWGSDTRLDRVQGAVVNLDEPIKLNGKLVPLGRQLAGGLVTGGDEPAEKNFDWLLTDADDAAEGIAAGRFAAVVTIPKNFSARATSFSKTKAEQIAPAEITVQTSQVAGITDAVVGQAISSAATSSLNTELTRQYLDQIYVGFNTTGKQFATVAKAAGDLSDGTRKVSDGIGKTATGAGDLADGLDQLGTGADKLSNGITQLGSGTSQLSSGLGKLADGAGKAASGGKQLAKGAAKLDKGTTAYAKGVGKAADGADQLANNVSRFADGSAQAAAGTRQFAAGLQKYQQQLSGFTPQQLAELVPCPLPPEQQQQGCPLFYAGMTAGTQLAAQSLDDLPEEQAPPAGKPPASCPKISPLSNGMTPGLLRGAVELCDGIRASATGAAALSDGVDRFSGGIGKLETGAKGIAGGVSGLADGTDQLADGLSPLASGTRQSATGASKLASGASQLGTGASALATGAQQSAEGARKLSDGLDQLATGSDKLADGSKKLADGLAKGAKQVPSYDKTTRTKLADVVATPVTQDAPEALFPNTASTTFLAVIALWLGGLASFLVLRAVPARALTSMKPAWRLAGEALLPAAAISLVQALALSVIFQLLFGLTAGATVALTGLLALAGVAFTALNQALVAWWGGVGRFVSVGLVVLAAAAAITSAVPTALTAVLPFLPLTPALEGARAVITAGDGVRGAAGMLLVWLVVGTGAAWLALARRRQLPAVVPAVT